MERNIENYIKALDNIDYHNNLIDINGYYCLQPENFKFLINCITIRHNPLFIQYINDPDIEVSEYAVRIYYDPQFETIRKQCILHYINNQTKSMVRNALLENIDEIKHVNIEFDEKMENFLFSICRMKNIETTEFVLDNIKIKHPRIRQAFLYMYPYKEVIESMGELTNLEQISCVRKRAQCIKYLKNPSHDVLLFAIMKSVDSIYAIYESGIELNDVLKYEVLERYWYEHNNEFSDDIYNLVMDKMNGNESYELKHEVNKLKLSRPCK